MKLHTGNGGITGMAMSHDQGEAWWMEGLCPEAREGLREKTKERIMAKVDRLVNEADGGEK